MSVDDWNAPTVTPVGPDSYGRFIRVRVFDCWMHEHDIRVALSRPDSDAEPAGSAPRLVLGEMATSMGFVVGKPAAGMNTSRHVVADRVPLTVLPKVGGDARG